MITRDALCPAIDIFPDEVGKEKCLLGYLFSVAQGPFPLGKSDTDFAWLPI